MSSNNKDIDQYLATLRKEGFTMHIARGGHWHIFTPGGKFIATCPASTSDYRSWRNTRRDIDARLGRGNRGKEAPPPPPSGSDPDVLELYRKQIRLALDRHKNTDRVFLEWKSSGEPVTEADLIRVLMEEERDHG
jgi:hypothetical protein